MALMLVQWEALPPDSRKILVSILSTGYFQCMFSSCPHGLSSGSLVFSSLPDTCRWIGPDNQPVFENMYKHIALYWTDFLIYVLYFLVSYPVFPAHPPHP